MQEAQEETQHVGSILEDGTSIAIETGTIKKGGDEIISEPLPFKQITDSIESISKAVLTTLQRVKPQKASVEFGIEIGAEEGQFLAIIVRGEGKANMRITLEWGEVLPSLTDEASGS
jgi:Trypsin-co-occurring domain 1